MTIGALFDRLAEYDAASFQAARDAASADNEHRLTERKLREAEAALAQYHRDQAKGDVAEDEAREVALIAAVQRIRGRLDPTAGNGRIVDLQAKAKASSARRRRDGAQVEKLDFVARHRDEFIPAMVTEAQAAEARLLAAVTELEAASSAWDATGQRWRKLSEGLGISPNEIPQNPTDNAIAVLKFALANKMTTPAPARLVTVEDDEITIDHTTAAVG